MTKMTAAVMCQKCGMSPATHVVVWSLSGDKAIGIAPGTPPRLCEADAQAVYDRNRKEQQR